MSGLDERRKAMMGEIDYGLPKNYMAVEYLESTSEKQWFDTGIKASSTLTVEAEWYVDRSTIADDYVIFYQGETSIGVYSFGLLSYNTTSSYNWCWTIGSERENFQNPTNHALRFHSKTTNKQCIINGVVEKTYSSNKFTSRRDIFIFGTSSSTRIKPNKGDDGTKRIYWMKIWDGQTLVRDFQPCLDASSTPCLYDRVSKQTFYNKGSLKLGYKLL
jgi:hypothetical protein